MNLSRYIAINAAIHITYSFTYLKCQIKINILHYIFQIYVISDANYDKCILLKIFVSECKVHQYTY